MFEVGSCWLEKTKLKHHPSPKITWKLVQLAPFQRDGPFFVAVLGVWCYLRGVMTRKDLSCPLIEGS